MWELISRFIPMSKRRRIREVEVYFSEELILEILFRLPTRSLFRFKCVCKTWQTLISDPNFLQKFIETTKFLPPLLTGFFYKQDEDLKFCAAGSETGCNDTKVVMDTPLDFLPCSIYVVAAHNGLVLCAKKPREGNILHYHRINYVICNSLTKQRFRLPLSKWDHRLTHTVLFSYNKGEYLEFKVVCFVSWQYNELLLETFSSETRKWVYSTITSQESFSLDHNCLFDGSVYFWKKGRLYVYDLKEETISVGKLPRRPGRSGRNTYMGESAGSLYYVESYSTCIKVWNLVNGAEWSLEHSNTECQNLENGLVNEILFPLAFHPVNPKLLLVTLGRAEVYLYCMEMRRLKLVPNFIPISVSASSPFAFQHGFLS